MTSTSKCQHCGRDLPQRDFALPGHKPMLITMPCDCPKAKEEQEREEREVERQERIDAFAEVWKRVGIPERFQHVKADTKTAAPLSEGRSLYLVGENGRGKTHAACACAKAYLARNTYNDGGVTRCWKSALFLDAQDMFTRLRTSWDRWDQTEEDVFQRWSGVDLLILDDLGAGVPSEWAGENVRKLVNSRWSNGRPMVITSQYGIDELADRYARVGDKSMGAILSRLGGCCDVLVFNGRDRRLE